MRNWFSELLEWDGIQESFSSPTELLSVVLCGLHTWQCAFWDILALSITPAVVWSFSFPPHLSPSGSILIHTQQSLPRWSVLSRSPGRSVSSIPGGTTAAAPSVLPATGPLHWPGARVSKTPSSFGVAFKGAAFPGIIYELFGAFLFSRPAAATPLLLSFPHRHQY